MKDLILIIDIGSTTTKALLLKKDSNGFHNHALVHTATTVEKPLEDVIIGINNAVNILEQNTGITLWQDKENSIPAENVSLYCTSSAGGGLQILVIGLTTFDSAASGKRCAFGAGAVILDTFAINDKRSAVQQMKAMARLHPDLILMTGGTDGGAIAPVVRLAELLQFANPRAKFSTAPIPLIFAGNIEAQPLIKGILKKRFQLHLVENVRPNMTKENHTPARNLIHELFMNYVMEQAPGYEQVLSRVADDIIPTPLAVLKAIELLHQEKSGDVMMVDIGGATTDVFSNMHSEFYRTVSANYGMSYSISNVFKDTGWEILSRELPPDCDADYVQDYIADKMLFPTCNPQASLHFLIEHILARAALLLARNQHLEMNFNSDRLGFLDKLVDHKNIESIVDKFYFKESNRKERFFLHDYHYAIGAGGVISHTQNPQQALMLIADGLQMQGLTLIFRDRDFTSPHLGKLSQIDATLAADLLIHECLQELGWHIRPQTSKWKAGTKVMRLTAQNIDLQVVAGRKYLLDQATDAELEYTIELARGFRLNDDAISLTLKTKLPLYIDTTFPDADNILTDFHELYELKDKIPALEEIFPLAMPHFLPQKGSFQRLVTLPYSGEIMVAEGDSVNPDMIIAENRSDPPKLYIITLFDRYNLGLNRENIKESLLVKEGEIIKMGQKIVDRKKLSLKEQMQGIAHTFDSPLRGIVENINFDAGTIILREVQDYSEKPVKVKISDRLGIKPAKMKGYLKVNEGDFVYSGDLIAAIRLDRANTAASSMLDKMNIDKSPGADSENTDSLKYNSIIAPATGTIENIDLIKGTLTIRYDRKPLSHYAGVWGVINSIKNALEIEINYEGWFLQGIIGFGAATPGTLVFCPQNVLPDNLSDNPVLLLTKPVDFAFLKEAENARVAGIIAPSIHYRDLKKYINDDIGVALTGNENIPFPLILMQGFGEYDLPPEMLTFFQSMNGASTFIDGHTQIRAGVTRPQIILQPQTEKI
ncbi:MAG: glutamate mutase L [Candidatus Cloacimonetes bacterium]|nr:glutamate mutase L [Candidatus Cloacimonadota bacterium]